MFLFSESEYKISIFYPKQQIFFNALANNEKGEHPASKTSYPFTL